LTSSCIENRVKITAAHAVDWERLGWP